MPVFKILEDLGTFSHKNLTVILQPFMRRCHLVKANFHQVIQVLQSLSFESKMLQHHESFVPWELQTQLSRKFQPTLETIQENDELVSQLEIKTHGAFSTENTLQRAPSSKDIIEHYKRTMQQTLDQIDFIEGPHLSMVLCLSRQQKQIWDDHHSDAGDLLDEVLDQKAEPDPKMAFAHRNS